MKKALIASILGIAVSVASSYGQGYIVMENYYNGGVDPSSAVYSTISFGGQPVGANWSAELLFRIGANPFVVVAGSATHFYPGSTTGGSPLTDGAGLFLGANQVIPGYVSGSVDFMLQVFNGTDFATSSLKGTSPIFTINGLQTNPLLPANDLINQGAGGGLQPLNIVVPEPTTLALAGLGSAALLIFRRRK